MDGDLSQPMSAVHFTSFPLPPTLALLNTTRDSG